MRLCPYTMRKRRHHGLFLLGCIVLLQIPLAEGIEKSVWQASYLAGVAPFPRGAHVQVSIDSEALRLAPRGTNPFVVPAQAITLVASNVKGTHPATRAEGQFLKDFAAAPGPCFPPEGCGAIVIFTAFLMAASYPVKTRDYLVRVFWREGNAEEEVLLRVGQKDYTPLMSELEKATGKTWKNMETEWARVQQEITSRQDSKIAIQLERGVRVGDSVLKPGPYQMVLLEREKNQGEVFFFPGDQVNIEHLSAGTRVELGPAIPDSGPLVTFREREGTTTFDQIKLPTRTVRFP